MGTAMYVCIMKTFTMNRTRISQKQCTFASRQNALARINDKMSTSMAHRYSDH